MNENNLSRVDLNLLKSLRALLDERHVGRAALKMNVTQSAMSHTLARLRDTFDDPLFIRHAKGLEPTARALNLSDKLNFILDEINSLMAPQTLNLSQVEARFRIQTHDFIVASYLSKAFNIINQAAPNIIIDVQPLAKNADEQLDNGQLDMLIGSGAQTNPRFKQKCFTDEALVCLVDKDNPVLRNWSAEAVFNATHIKLSLLDAQDDPVTQYGKDNGFPERKIGLYTESLNLQLSLIPNSKLIAFMPESIAQQGHKLYGLELKNSPFPLPKLTIRGVWHQRHQKDQLHKWIRDTIGSVFKDISQQ